MYDGLYTSSVDIYPTTIPLLNTPPTQSIPISHQHREFNSSRVETIIVNYVSATYLKLLNWNNVYLAKFPSSLLTIPAIIYKSHNQEGICLNMDLSTGRMDIKTNSIMITDYAAFASCVIYGLNLLLLNNLKDEQVLSDVFYSMCGFVYNLIIRAYIKDINISEMSDQDIANMYYLVCKLVSTNYFKISGNLNALLTVATQRFFIKEDNVTKKKIVTAKFASELLPKTEDISGFESLFVSLDKLDIFPNVSLVDFRTKVAKFFSPILLSCMANGLHLSGILASSKTPSSIFNQKIMSVRPASLITISNSLNKYLLILIKNPPSQDNIIPEGWV